MNVAKLLRLDFLPRSTDVGLLVLRIWIGGSMLMLHGFEKVKNFEAMSKKFMDFLGIGATASLSLAIFAEFLCSGLLILGLFTRFAALSLAITMGVAFFMAHGGVLKGPGSGEMAFIYLSTYVVLLLAGPGKFSLDAKMGGKV